MRSKVFLLLICYMGLAVTISCQNIQNQALQTFIKPYLGKEYKHLLVVPQMYCRNCIRTLFEKAENNTLNPEVGILFLEINTHSDVEISGKIQVAKYSEYYKATQDKSTKLVWIQLENGQIKGWQKLNSEQFYEQLPNWIR